MKKDFYLVKNCRRSLIDKILEKDDMIVWYNDNEYKVIAPCYLPYKDVYKYIMRLFPYSFITNNIMRCTTG